jgi:hypothetical protein
VLQLLALIGAPAHCRMKSEAVEFGTQARLGGFVCRGVRVRLAYVNCGSLFMYASFWGQIFIYDI